MAATAPAPTPAPAPEAPPTTTPTARPVYTRVQVLGLLCAAAAPAIMLVAALAAGLEVADELMFFGMGIAVPLIAAGLSWRFGLWAKAVGIVAALAVGLLFFWMAFGLAYPSSPVDFVPGILLPIGVLLGVGGGIAAIVQRRRGHFETAATPAERMISLAVLVLLVAAVIVSAVLLFANRSSADAAAEIEVVLYDFAFDQDSYTVSAGEATTLVVRNNDPFMHTFTIPDLGIDEMMSPGSAATIELTADSGSYTIYCEPHSDMNEPDAAEAGMAATLVAE